MMHSNETTQVEALTTRISLLMARLEQLVQTVENLEAKAKDAEEEKFYDINDLARIFNRFSRTIFNWRATGELPMKEIGGSWFISRTELQKYMNTNPNKTKGAGHVRS